MSILLINPHGGYHHEYPPLGLLYIASYLREKGRRIIFLDEGTVSCPGEEYSSLVEEHRPRFVALSLYTTNISRAYHIITTIKSNFPDCIIIVGGHHATALPGETIEECSAIDYLVAGEGEVTLHELLNAIESGQDIETVKGVYINNGHTSERLRFTGEREYFGNLDALPLPAHDLIDLSAYSQNEIRLGKRVGVMITSRGCPYSCTFCNKAVFKSVTRRRSPANVVQEIRYLIATQRIDEIYFQDDLFALDRRWLAEFLEEMKRNDIALPWRMLARVDILEESDYQSLKKGGCYLVQFGVESGNETVLKDIRKGITTDQVRRAFRMAREAGLQTYGFFIFGHKLDTLGTIRETFELAKDIRCDFTSFFLLVPFPGTAVYSSLTDEYRRDWSRIQYVNWNRGLDPISLCGVPGRLLKCLEQQVNMAYYGRISYLFANVLRFAPFSLFVLKLRWWLRNIGVHLFFKLRRGKHLFAK